MSNAKFTGVSEGPDEKSIWSFLMRVLVIRG